MSKNFKIPAEMRTDVGKGASRRLRRAGRVPAVVYGADRDPATISVDHDSVLHMAEEEAFHASILELTVGDGRRQKVVLRDLQRHPYKPLLTHIDFLRVSDDQQVRMSVPIHFVNEEKSKAGKKAGVVISHQTVEVEIDALPKDLPEYLEVDLANLEPGESVMLSQIVLPEGVTIPALEISEDNDHPIVTAIFIREGQGSGEAAAEADAAVGQAAEVETVAESESSEEAEEGESSDEES
ncbi:50S ribosomal protein L25/general stress protein Ctc [Wenzhouxiangella marina]|uniref:Large ribosomal subunit protein bL25 n=1 Tax=Wenzhouxiangella marina TaxID=1579979 RepID=A0A0K0XYG7_9GAMM|nr:50S ribosomal protein L25/general stress protein Ctc [Wenzhouxiangella marina]AKS42676.1 50S ribosomal protein L25 [Wenzhouxiangella marina]MBB6088635.1 large subunit ribosomal protein L25 [Wenzhouxiangella marina]